MALMGHFIFSLCPQVSAMLAWLWGLPCELRPACGCSLPCGLPGSTALSRQAHQLCCCPAVSEKRSSITLQAQEEYKKKKHLSAVASFQQEIEQIGVVRPCSSSLCSCGMPWVWGGVFSLSPASLLLLPAWVVLSVSPKHRRRWNQKGHVQGACYRNVLSVGSPNSQKIPVSQRLSPHLAERSRLLPGQV